MSNSEPLVLFVNSRSGGQQGTSLMTGLKAYLNANDKLFDLANGGPEPGLKEFEETKKPYRVVACGGDGTVGWVLSTFDKIHLSPNPPMAILPLGTGNDISRTLNWGPGYAGEDLGPIINKFRASKPIVMDRWKAVYQGLPEADKPKESIVNAYLGLGVDAEIALKFHSLREEMPGLFKSRALNKVIYSHCGFTSMLKSHASFSDLVSMELDGKIVPIPKNLSGILLLNLPSWGGGRNPWGTDKHSKGTNWSPQVIDDSTLEVIGFTGAFHLAQIQTNLQYGIRIAQAKSVKLTTKQPLPVQVDGEPWILNPCTIAVSLLSKTKVLLYDTEEDNYTPPITPIDETSRIEIKELASFTFSVEKLDEIKKQHPNQLDKGQFIQVLNQVTGLKFDEKNPALTERLFFIFDADKSGTIDFKELNVGLSVLGEGTLEKKLKFVFSLFDTLNTGRITRDQLTITFKTLFSMLYAGNSEKLVPLYVNLLLELYDENKDQTITYDELLTAAKNDEILAHLFTFGTSHQKS